MGKVIVTLLAAFTIMCFLYMFLGNRLNHNVYQSSHFSLSWFVLVGGVVTFGVWRIVKGK